MELFFAPLGSILSSGKTMKNDIDNAPTGTISKIVALLLGVPWIEVIAEVWKVGKKVFRGLSDEGMYEVLEYESTLEILDPEGKRAIFKKRKKVCYLQDNIIAYQDYGWGDGEHFRDYRAQPGVPVDRYKIGYKTYILLSLREVKNRGDVDEFHIQWKIRNGFLKTDGFWETDVSSRTKSIRVNVIFPKEHPPYNIRLVETNIQKTTILGHDSIKQLPNGNWQIAWSTARPRLYEHYILRWDW